MSVHISVHRTSGRRLVVAAAMTGLALAAAASPAVAAGHLTIGARHVVGSTFAVSSNNVMSCPPGRAVTSTTCYLVGDGPGGTAPAGMTAFPPDDYLAQVVPVHDGKPGTPIDFPGSESAELVSCVSTTACETVGYSTTFSKAAFIPLSSGHPGKPVAVPGDIGWSGLFCHSVGNCLAAGTWRKSESSNEFRAFVVQLSKGKVGAEHFLPGTFGVSSLSCSSLSSCVVVGSTTNDTHGYYATVTNGKPGKVHVVTQTGGLYDVACGWTKGSCLAKGSTTLSSKGIFPVQAVIRGSSVTVTKESTTLPSTSVECLSVGHCLEFGVANPNSSKEHAVVAVVTSGKVGAFVTVPAVADITWLACGKVGSCTGIGSSLTGQYPGDIQRTFTVT